MTTLITGARGKVAQSVVGRLHAAGHSVRAASKTPAELTVPDGVQTVELALDRPETFEAALRDVRQVFLYPEPAGIDAFLKAADAAGVTHIVLLSSSAVLAPDAESHPIALTNLLVERALAASPITSTVLRPDAFMTNTLGWSYGIRDEQPVQLPYPNADIPAIHTDDLADIAFAALSGDAALIGKAFTLTGGESLTFTEQITILGRVLGREIPIQVVTRAEAEEHMGRFMPPVMIGALLDLWAAASTTPAALGDTTQTLLGTPARTFEQWARENASAFNQ